MFFFVFHISSPLEHTANVFPTLSLHREVHVLAPTENFCLRKSLPFLCECICGLLCGGGMDAEKVKDGKKMREGINIL